MILTKKKYKKIDERVARIDVFYSREWKAWGVIKYNKDGMQIGSGLWFYIKKEALAQKKEFEKNHKLKRR